MLLLSFSLTQVVFGEDNVSQPENLKFEVVSMIRDESDDADSIPYLEFELFLTNNYEESKEYVYGNPCNTIKISAFTSAERTGKAVWNGFPINFAAPLPLMRECLGIGRYKKLEPKQRQSLLVDRYRLDEVPLPDGLYYFTADINIRDETGTLNNYIEVKDIDAGDEYIQTSTYIKPVPTYKEHLGIGYSGTVKQHDKKIQIDLEVTSIDSDKVINSQASNNHFSYCSIWLAVYSSETDFNRWLWNWQPMEDTWPYFCLVNEFKAITLSEQDKYVFSYFIDELDWKHLDISEVYFLIVSDLQIQGAVSEPLALLNQVGISIGQIEFE